MYGRYRARQSMRIKRDRRINNEWLYSTMSAVIFLPKAARLVNTKNLSMFAVSKRLCRNQCCFPSFIPELDLQLMWKNVTGLSPVTKPRCVPVVCVTQRYHSQLKKTSPALVS